MINKDLVLEGVRIGFRNFSGEPSQFNNKGDRNFCVFLTPEDGNRFKEDGWNIKWTRPRSEDDDSIPYLQVAVRFGNYPPKIVVINGKGKRYLDESTVHILDWAEIENVDMIIRPYNYEIRGTTGVKAYLKSMYITLVEDEFEQKYRDIPDQDEVEE